LLDKSAKPIPCAVGTADPERLRRTRRVTWIGFFVNLASSLFKLAAGIIGRSAAMVADAVHSLSDLLSDIVVLIGVRLSARPVDEDHDYGHGKFETLTGVLIGILILATGIGLLWSGTTALLRCIEGEWPAPPGWIALYAAGLSIVLKEILYRYTIRSGRILHSQPLIANAWHHRSDAFSSIGTMCGIGGAILLGDKWAILDPVAGMVVSLFILHVGFRIARQGIRELLDASLPTAIEDEIRTVILGVPGTESLHKLRTRTLGAYYAIDVHVQVARKSSLIAAHDVSSAVEEALRERFGRQTFISIHIEPGT
jgi:cation diffusion facilitator family transporter